MMSYESAEKVAEAARRLYVVFHARARQSGLYGALSRTDPNAERMRRAQGVELRAKFPRVRAMPGTPQSGSRVATWLRREARRLAH